MGVPLFLAGRRRAVVVCVGGARQAARQVQVGALVIQLPEHGAGIGTQDVVSGPSALQTVMSAPIGTYPPVPVATERARLRASVAATDEAAQILAGVPRDEA